MLLHYDLDMLQGVVLLLQAILAEYWLLDVYRGLLSICLISDREPLIHQLCEPTPNISVNASNNFCDCRNFKFPNRHSESVISKRTASTSLSRKHISGKLFYDPILPFTHTPIFLIDSLASGAFPAINSKTCCCPSALAKCTSTPAFCAFS